MLRRAIQGLSRLVRRPKMASVVQSMEEQIPEQQASVKRGHEKDGEEEDVKKQKLEGRVDRKKKVALLFGYCGKGYHGLQINKDMPTIERDILQALVKAECIPQGHADDMSKMSFQRASRTDKGVSAAGQVISLKMLLNQENLIQKINDNLPKSIKVFGHKRTTRGFNSKNHCSSRTYLYLTPTYAFAPVEKFLMDEYRTTPEILNRVNEILKLFKGTHNFHNFTSGIKPTDPSAKRYIIDFTCGEPFVREGIEFVKLTVKGQSFMMHHIRKMIGLTIAVVRGFCNEEVIELAWKADKVDIPKAPGLGLVLDQLHFDGYNTKFGKDGIHEPIEWDKYKDEIEKFKEEYIFTDIIKTEKEEKSMMRWMAFMNHHTFEPYEGGEAQVGPWRWGLRDKLNREREIARFG
ncbi:hypothetical protein CHS0354_036442 [Potamilus streckersoni]|uniref:Pseudouridylate synthase 1 homolog n=1 Tax=Potamilus streckersoni TaxID=2493646 RepID=A0AAE0SWM7_9BIVA|nr:hypothetical protein CHS0354_036442 [Potamilus streckersoni]